MINGVILAHYRCNLLTLFLLAKLTTIHFYVDSLGLLGRLECFDDLFLYGDHPSHHLREAVRQLVCFFGRYNDLPLAFLT